MPDEFDLPLSVVFQLAQFKKQLKFIYEELAKLGKHEAKVSPVLTGQYANRSFATMGRRTSGSSDAAKEVEIHERDLALLVEMAKKKKEAKEADKAALKIEERYFEQLAKTASVEDARAQRERERQEKAIQKEKQRNELIARRASLSGDVNYRSNAEIRYLKQQEEIEKRKSKYQRKYGDLQTEFGTTDVSKIDKEIERRKKLDQARKDNFASQRKLASEQLKGVQGQIQLNKALDTAIGKLIRYRVAFAAMYKLYEGFTQSIQAFIDINYKLAQIEKIIRPTRKELEQIGDIAFDLSKQYAIAVGDILDSFRIWGQTGLRQKELIDAVNASLIASNALGIDAKAITEDLTAAIFSYEVEAENLTDVIDKWMAVQREYPVTAEDLANGMKKVGIAAKNLGIDIDELNGYLASIAAVTRKSGSEIGNSLKTIFARLPRDLTIQALQSVGIATKKNENEFRDFSVVLDELAQKWGTLSDIEQRNIAQQAAGVRRYVDFLALMENYSVALSATATSQGAFGEAVKASATEVATVKKQIQELKNIYIEFGESFGKELFPVIRTFISILKGLAESLSSPIFKKGLSVVTTLVGGFVALKAGVLAAKFAYAKLGATIFASIPSIYAASRGFIAQGVAIKVAVVEAQKLRASLLALRATNIVFLIISAAATAMLFLRDSTKSALEELEEFNEGISVTGDDVKQAKQSLEAQRLQLEAINRMASERGDLLKILNQSKKGTQDYEKALKQLTLRESELASKSTVVANTLELYGENASLAKEGSEALAESIDLLIKKQKDLVDEAQKAYERNKELFLLQLGGITQEELEKQRKILDRGQKLYYNYGQALMGIYQNIDIQSLFDESFDKTGFNAEKFRNKILSEINKVLRKQPELIDFNNFLQSDDFKGLTPEQKKVFQDFYNASESYISDLADDIANFEIPTTIKGANGVVFPGLSETSEFLKDAEVNAANTKSRVDDLGEAISKFGEPGTKFNNILGGTNSELYNLSNNLSNTIKLIKSFSGAEDKGADDNSEYFDSFYNAREGIIKLLVEWDTLKKKLGEGFGNELRELEKIAEYTESDFNPYEERIKWAEKYYKKVQDFLNDRKEDEIRITKEIELRAKELGALKLSGGGYRDEETAKDLEKDLRDLREQLTQILELYQNVSKESKVIEDFLGSVLRSNTKNLKSLEKNIELLNTKYDQQISVINELRNVYGNVFSDQNKAISYQIGALTQLRAQYIALASAALLTSNLSFYIEYADSIKEINKLLNDMQKELDTIQIEKKFEPLKRFAQEFRTAASAGLGDIQSRWIDAAEKRNDLEEQLVLARKDLNEATVEGNQEMMLEAKKEIRALEDELNKVNSIVRTIGESLRDAFLQLADATFRNVMDDIAAQLTDMLVATSKLGDVSSGYVGMFGNVNQGIVDAFNTGSQSASSNMKSSLIAAGSIVAGQIAGSLISDSVGGRQGAAIGSTFGAAAGTAGILGATGWAAGPIGGLLGGLAGAALGSLFGKDEEKPDDYVPVLEKNTDAVKANTKALEELSELVVNAPTNYRVPAFGGGYGGSVNLNFNGASSSEVRSALSILEEYGIDIRSTRTRARVVI